MIAAVAVLFGVIECVPAAQADTNVVPDVSFRACLNRYLGQSADASVSAEQLTGLDNQSVQCVSRGIESITGAEYLTGVINLDLSGNQISDISPLNGLTELEALNVANDPVTSIAPLAGLTNLMQLSIDNTQVKDLTPIASLANLRELTLGTLPTNEVSSPASIRGLSYGADMALLTLTTQMGIWVTLPGPNFACPWGVPCAPGGPVRTWSVQSGGASIDAVANRAMVTSSGTTVLTWTDSGPDAGAPGKLIITARVSCNGFTDVSVSQRFYDSICWLASNCLTTGSNPAGTTFSPDAVVTRGQAAAFLYRMAGSPVVTLPAEPIFTDVSASSRFYDEITWLSQQKITIGSNATGTMFSPDAVVTRGQMAAFLYRMAGSPSVSLPAVSPFTDVTGTNRFYKEIIWLQQQKITVGSNPAGTTFSPDDPVTRGQVAAFLQRLAGTRLQCGVYADAVGC